MVRHLLQGLSWKDDILSASSVFDSVEATFSGRKRIMELRKIIWRGEAVLR
jgi:hypothetical protein